VGKGNQGRTQSSGEPHHNIIEPGRGPADRLRVVAKHRVKRIHPLDPCGTQHTNNERDLRTDGERKQRRDKPICEVFGNALDSRAPKLTS
jgi:hypothetical protein